MNGIFWQSPILEVGNIGLKGDYEIFSWGGNMEDSAINLIWILYDKLL